MKCTILHESGGRIRVHLACRAMSLREADVLEYYLRAVPGVVDVKVFDLFFRFFEPKRHLVLPKVRIRSAAAAP